MESAGTDSPPLRNTILGNFLGRGRPRNSSQSHIDVAAAQRELSPSPPGGHQPPSPNPFAAPNILPMPNTGNSRAGRRAGPPVAGAPSTSPAGLNLSHMLRRRRSAGNVASTPTAAVGPVLPTPSVRASVLPALPAPNASANTGGAGGGGPSHRIRLVPHLESRRSLRFDPIARDLRAGEPALRIGRFTDRSGLGLAAVNALSTNKIAFKSKVVSRAHAEVWIEADGMAPKFYIRDTKSSSGTFLNHVRLSPANTERRRRGHLQERQDPPRVGQGVAGSGERIQVRRVRFLPFTSVFSHSLWIFGCFIFGRSA
ncbi:hypothetical protein B0H19DRAFT_604655 [Mycena capillaripes]|nr:hypothetical protein B0H19DRAFT_604655 [Mycena capillaripes]